jgi:membrane-anchored mycosin MYCP
MNLWEDHPEVAALTFQVPPRPPASDATLAMTPPVRVDSRDLRARNLGLVVLLGCAVLAGIAISVLKMPTRK